MKKYLQLFVFFFVLFLTSSCAKLLTPKVQTDVGKLKPGAYSLDPEHASLLFKVGHLGFSKYVGRFNTFEANLDFDPEDMGAAKMNGRVDMASVDVNNQSLESTIKGSSWFNVKEYPYAHFETQSVALKSQNVAVFTGPMTFLGNTHPIDIEVTFNGGARNMLTGKYTIGFEAKSSFLRSDFGLNNYIPAVGDKVELEIYAEFQRQ